jgi:futalosine hydrolase
MPSPLILVPTRIELQTLEHLLSPAVREGGGRIELCGFGAIAAAARTAQLIARHEPDRIILVGIAGAIGDRLSVGAAYEFNEVACYGIGAGSNAEHLSADDLGFRHWSDKAGPAGISDVISLTSGSKPETHQLLTACAAAGGADDVRLRRQYLPDACAEDMEGFAVALACQLADTPLQIIRGISNVAGDRDKTHWKMEEALYSAADLVVKSIASHESAPHK